MRFLTTALLLMGLMQLAQSQAPFDSDAVCTTNPAFQSQQNEIPEEHFVLVDTYAYISLMGFRSVWITRDLDGDGQMWRESGGLCQTNLVINTCRLPVGSQQNWLFTQYISYEDSEEITFDFNFRLNAPCSTCEIPPIVVHRFDTNRFQSTDTQVDISLYSKMTSLEQVGTTDNFFSLRIPRPSDPTIKGFYLAFEDQGTCGQIRRTIAYHRIAPGFRDATNLVTCPNVPRPQIGSEDTTSATCTCDANSVTTTGLERTCGPTGQCTTDLACACVPGYELSSDGKCTICPPGTFKSTVSNTEKCTPCPQNSQALFEGSEVCQCACGTVRPSDQPGAACNSPPSSPLLANNNPPMVDEAGLTLSWLPAENDGGNPVHYNVFTFDPSTQKYIRQNIDDEILPNASEELVQYTIKGLDQSESVSVVVTSASSATGDFAEIEDLTAVQNRFIAFYVALKPKDQQDTIIIEDITPDNIVAEDIVVPDSVVIIEIPTAIVPEPEISTQAPTTPEPEISTQAPTTQEVVPTDMPQLLFFQLGDEILNNGSSVSLARIGEGDKALLCLTDNKDNCCRSNRVGEFYYPNGATVPVRAIGESVYRNRGPGIVRLNNTGRDGTPLGQYRCEILDSEGQLRNLFITITA